MKKPGKMKGTIDRSETFDEFLAKEGLLAKPEDAAIKQIVGDKRRQGVVTVTEKD